VFKAIRRDCLRSIADEKKYARLGGVQNNLKLYRERQCVRRMDAMLSPSRGYIVDGKQVVPASCNNPDVKRVLACYEYEERVAKAQTPGSDVDAEDKDRWAGEVPGIQPAPCNDDPEVSHLARFLRGEIEADMRQLGLR
jgi:hypothetical protein